VALRIFLRANDRLRLDLFVIGMGPPRTPEFDKNLIHAPEDFFIFYPFLECLVELRGGLQGLL
jgi:hypothetical protein